MARKQNVERFYTHIKQEGDAGATRGKIPVQMGRTMGAKDGDIIEWEVVNGDCVGGRVLTKAERKEYEREQARNATPRKTTTRKVEKPAKTKPVVKDKSSGSSKPTGKKLVKPSKRRTEVSFDTDERPRRSVKKKPISFKKKRR